MSERIADISDQFDIFTDLALEAHQVIIQRGGGPEIAGVRVETEEKEVARVSRVVVADEQAARRMGKAVGTYVTLESEALRNRNQEEQEQLAQQLAREIQQFLADLKIPENGSCLVVGLGNRHATPDALGPRTVSELLVTRHLYEMVPPELRGGLRPVAAMAPGVLGLTGIETSEIIRGVVDRIHPSVVICVDALAARSSDRLCATIQIADTGISPGAGVGNVRKAINEETLGVPVLALGVPTVIHAMTIVGDAIDWITRRLTGQAPPLTALGGVSAPQNSGSVRLDPRRIRVHGQDGSIAAVPADTRGQKDPLGLPLDQAQKRYMLRDLLGDEFGQMIVTPKEIDVLIDDVAQCLAGALNAALHPSLDLDEILLYLGS